MAVLTSDELAGGMARNCADHVLDTTDQLAATHVYFAGGDVDEK